MERFFKVQEAINKDLLKKSIPLCCLSIVNLFLWGISVEVFIKYLPIALIFSYMIVEDYVNREVDLRLVGLVFLLISIVIPNLENFFRNLLSGTIIFLSFFFIACRSRKISDKENCFVDKEIELGFLPSLGLAILIFSIIGKCELFSKIIPRWEDISLEVFLFLSIPFLIFFIGRYYRMQIKEKNKEVVIEEGFGMGDVFVCAIGFGLWGGTDFLTILFIAFLLQIGAYRYQTIKTKDELHGI